MDPDLFWENGPIRTVVLFKVLDDVRHTGSNKEVFLLEPQGTAGLGAVVGIENAGDGLNLIPFPHGPGIIAVVKGGQIQFFHHRFCAPEPEDVDGFSAVAHDGYVIGHRQNGLSVLGHIALLTVLVRNPIHISAKLDGNGLVGLLGFPGVAIFQPAVGLLRLVAIDDPLPEQSEPIADPHAHAGDAQIGHGIQETGCQTAQAAVAQTGILFALAQFVQVDAEVLQSVLHSNRQSAD